LVGLLVEIPAKPVETVAPYPQDRLPRPPSVSIFFLFCVCVFCLIGSHGGRDLTSPPVEYGSSLDPSPPRPLTKMAVVIVFPSAATGSAQLGPTGAERNRSDFAGSEL
jgi:hypothetical protein